MLSHLADPLIGAARATTGSAHHDHVRRRGGITDLPAATATMLASIINIATISIAGVAMMLITMVARAHELRLFAPSPFLSSHFKRHPCRCDPRWAMGRSNSKPPRML
jgi:hypothetical protein